MALIKCKDCENEISDSAESCPKCGAPVPKAISDDEEQCPFCMTAVHQDAMFCPSCNAEKGYTQASGNVYGKYMTMFWGILVPGFIGLMLLSVGIVEGQGVGVLVIGLIFFIPVVLSIRRLKTGPVWFKGSSR